ncbi:TetR/AcrR family transcriptional regulator, partial [Listeria welshimeri]
MADVRTPIQKRSLEKKQKIINAGFELFCEKGYYQTSTNEICKRAGVSTGALYSYFTDKKDIF